MAKCTVVRAEPITPPIKSITLELTEQEALVLAIASYGVCGPGPSNGYQLKAGMLGITDQHKTITHLSQEQVRDTLRTVGNAVREAIPCGF